MFGADMLWLLVAGVELATTFRLIYRDINQPHDTHTQNWSHMTNVGVVNL